MNSRREFREMTKTYRESSTHQVLSPKAFGALRLFILLLLFSQNALSQKNIGNQQYDINDPRNPNCPCHQYQKMADDEYNQNQKNKQVNQFAVNNNNFNQEDNSGNDNSANIDNSTFSRQGSERSIGSGSSYRTVKKKKPGTWVRKKAYRSKLKHSRIKKQRPNYSVCYKW